MTPQDNDLRALLKFQSVSVVGSRTDARLMRIAMIKLHHQAVGFLVYHGWRCRPDSLGLELPVVHVGHDPIRSRAYRRFRCREIFTVPMSACSVADRHAIETASLGAAKGDVWPYGFLSDRHSSVNIASRTSDMYDPKSPVIGNWAEVLHLVLDGLVDFGVVLSKFKEHMDPGNDLCECVVSKSAYSDGLLAHVRLTWVHMSGFQVG